jgi:hypothetical protein
MKKLMIIIMFFSPFAFADRHFVNEKIFVNEQIAENDLSVISYLNSDFEIIQITQKSPDVSIYHLHRYDLLEDVFEKHSLVICEVSHTQGTDICHHIRAIKKND